MLYARIIEGGTGSGNYGHAGRPGLKGGSKPGTGYSVKNYVPAPEDKLKVADVIAANKIGLDNRDSFFSYYTPVLQKAYNLGQLGIDLSKCPVVFGIRYGKAPDSGISYNYLDGKSERGLSLIQERGKPIIPSEIWFSARKTAYEYHGIKVGIGSDGETLILPLHVDNLE